MGDSFQKGVVRQKVCVSGVLLILWSAEDSGNDSGENEELIPFPINFNYHLKIFSQAELISGILLYHGHK
jgi:hypothetical protein